MFSLCPHYIHGFPKYQYGFYFLLNKTIFSIVFLCTLYKAVIDKRKKILHNKKGKWDSLSYKAPKGGLQKKRGVL